MCHCFTSSPSSQALHLSAFCLQGAPIRLLSLSGYFLPTKKPTSLSKGETYKFRARYDQKCLLCVSPDSRQAYAKIWKTDIPLLNERQSGLGGGCGSTWVLDVDLGSNHNSGSYCATQGKAHNCLDSVSQSQSERY